MAKYKAAENIHNLKQPELHISEMAFPAPKAGLSWDDFPLILEWDVGRSESCQQISSLTHTAERRWLSASPSLPVQQAIRHRKFHLAKTFLCEVRNHIDMDLEVSDEIATQTWMVWA